MSHHSHHHTDSHHASGSHHHHSKHSPPTSHHHTTHSHHSHREKDALTGTTTSLDTRRHVATSTHTHPTLGRSSSALSLGPLSPASTARERALRELLEREVRERELGRDTAAGGYAVEELGVDDGTVRDPRLRLSYNSQIGHATRDRDYIREREYESLLLQRELDRERLLLRDRELELQASRRERELYPPRGLDQFAVGAGDADDAFRYDYDAKYGDDLPYDAYDPRRTLRDREPYPSRYDSSYRLTHRRSRSPRSRLETYAEERAREAAELERERERREGSPTTRGRRRYTEAEERERERERKAAYRRDLSSLSSGLGALSIREREEKLARERELEYEYERERARSHSRGRHHTHSHHRPHSATRPVWKPSATSSSHGYRYSSTYDSQALSPYERARLGSPSRTGLRSPVTGTYGSKTPLSTSASFATAPYSSTFNRDLVDPLRSREFDYERERELVASRSSRDLRDTRDWRARELRERELRELEREREIADAGRFGETLGAAMVPSSGYDSDDERVFYHPRKHGSHAYYQQHFSGYAEPIGSGLGGLGATRNGHWLDEFYRPVDVRASKGQWLASLQPPSYSLRNNPGVPEARLKLEWIYGYKSFDVRNNLVYNNVGDIIYPVASVVVVYKHAHRIQRHFQAHNDEVRCLAQHPINLNIIASGQTAVWTKDENGRAPHIAVWDSTDFSKVWVLELTPADKSIRALSFSSNGKYLVSISNDVHHTIKLWDWETRTMLGSSRGDSYALFAVKWNHKDPTEFVTVGKQHAVFWKFDGVKLTARKAHLPGGKNITFYSVAFSEKGYACLGSEDGGIYVFVDGRLVREFKKVHRGKVFCLDWFPGGLISGGGDGVVNILDKKLDIIRSFTFHHRITSLYCRGNHLLIGTQGSQIFEIVDFMETNIEGDVQAGSRPGPGNEFQSPDGRIGIEPIVQGHYDGELHGIATTPGGREIVSVGEDNQICVWEMTTHRLLRKAHLSDEPNMQQVVKRRNTNATTSTHPMYQCARAVAVSPNGKFITVGLNNGEIGIYTSHDLRRVFTHDLNQYSKRQQHSTSYKKHHHQTQHPHWIQCIKYSPNGHVVAIGTHGAVIVLLDARDDYRVKGVLQTHESFITNIDFSEDGCYLASTDGQHHLRFHQLFENDLAQSTQVVDQRAIRDVKWASQNCVLGYTVQGIIETGEAEGYSINCLEVSPSRSFVVSGDDAGQVQLFRFPVLERGHQSHAYHSHASHVVNIRWSIDEKYVISAGGHDNAICQWVLL